MSEKIFGIGMPKTGTTSLHHALEILGYKSIHFPHDKKTVRELEEGKYDLSVLKKHDALCDVPIPAIYPQLDRYWPNSKFILTVRDIEKWLDSCENAPFNSPKSIPKKDHFRYFYRSILYGTISFNRDRFRWVYENHIRTVNDYFSGERQQQILIMDITKDDGWEKLCDFLNRDKPTEPFPRSNARGS